MEPDWKGAGAGEDALLQSSLMEGAKRKLLLLTCLKAQTCNITTVDRNAAPGPMFPSERAIEAKAGGNISLVSGKEGFQESKRVRITIPLVISLPQFIAGHCQIYQVADCYFKYQCPFLQIFPIDKGHLPEP